MNGDGERGVALHLLEPVQRGAAAFALQGIAGIGEALQFLEHEARDDERAAEEAGRADTGDAAVDDDVRVDEQRRVLHGGLAEAHIRDDEGEFVAVAADGEHHPDVAESGIDDQSANPLRLRWGHGEDAGGEEQFGKNEPDQQAEGG